jgi:hypothetical protein
MRGQVVLIVVAARAGWGLTVHGSLGLYNSKRPFVEVQADSPIKKTPSEAETTFAEMLYSAPTGPGRAKQNAIEVETRVKSSLNPAYTGQHHY